MGYDLHITRADNWMDAAEHPIFDAAWTLVVDGDPSLELRTTDSYDYRDSSTGKTVRVHPVIWKAHAEEPAFWLMKGEITCKNPDESTVAKMKEIAAKLGARVFGDDDEEY
jgi:hypothetical protein